MTAFQVSRTVSLEERFRRKLGPTTESGCILWTGYRRKDGYGRICRDGRRRSKLLVFTHRLAYELAYGPIPDGMFVLHRCDNPPCCNPSHLFLGTQTENMTDMTSKGRRRHGIVQGKQCWAAKLTDDLVREIRRRFKAGGIDKKQLAREYGIHRTTIGPIIAGKAWKHVT